ncbi:hypothetical protein KAJ27_05650 [bacterium]|nr:hypothetical protein [bacterium]
MKVCPYGAIQKTEHGLIIQTDICFQCNICKESCPRLGIRN